MKIVTIVGARPQFIKAAPVSRAIRGHNEKDRDPGITEVLVHTGQHYDHGMSQIFFDELDISEPDLNLGVGSGNHGWQTGQILVRIEEVLLEEKPDLVVVYGDTNSTLAGALAAVKLHIPVAHVEAGLRSFNRTMPEEHNRVVADHCSDLLFCPTQTAVDNLALEGITTGVHLVGDTMYDAVLQCAARAQKRSTVLEDLNLKPKTYLLTTIHRPYNTDIPKNLRNIFQAFAEIGEVIIFPVHPRTSKKIAALESEVSHGLVPGNVKMIEPVGYLDMLVLEENARLILTDSGGMQKEAYFFGVPCITLRPETEWVETVESGWNVVAGADTSAVVQGYQQAINSPPTNRPHLYGDGRAAEYIVERILEQL
ncbi:MAG: UDP-N-acetylglucosamine 2-epimerase (non-hydrolyzing) [Syntrophobacterales bacterium]|jgi:UDP-N-acetylglucosamine 2-epimerase